MSRVVELTSAHFQKVPSRGQYPFELVLAKKSPCLVMFKQASCPYCVKLEPVIHELSVRDNRIEYCFADISKYRDIHRMSKDTSVQISSVPIIMFFHQGLPIARFKNDRPKTIESIYNFVTNVLTQRGQTPNFVSPPPTMNQMPPQQHQMMPPQQQQQPMLHGINMDYQMQNQQQMDSESKMLMPDNIIPYNQPWDASGYKKL